MRVSGTRWTSEQVRGGELDGWSKGLRAGSACDRWLKASKELKRQILSLSAARNGVVDCKRSKRVEEGERWRSSKAWRVAVESHSLSQSSTVQHASSRARSSQLGVVSESVEGNSAKSRLDPGHHALHATGCSSGAASALVDSLDSLGDRPHNSQRATPAPSPPDHPQRRTARTAPHTASRRVQTRLKHSNTRSLAFSKSATPLRTPHLAHDPAPLLPPSRSTP